VVLNPDHVAARVNLGRIFYLQGRWEEAIAQYRAALERESSSHALFNLGLAYLAQGDIDRAGAVYAQGLRQFGPEGARESGGIKDLENLVEKGIQTEAARRILESMGMGK